MVKSLCLQAQDNVGTMLGNAEPEDTISITNPALEEVSRIRAENKIVFGHKVALRDIAEGEKIIKCAAVIGKATRDIRKGEHVHIHNVVSIEGTRGVKRQDA